MKLLFELISVKKIVLYIDAKEAEQETRVLDLQLVSLSFSCHNCELPNFNNSFLVPSSLTSKIIMLI